MANSKEVCVCLHGHFYQPPRENPWTEAVELQESAAPFHDWNDRIFFECYLPNSRARVLDKAGDILDIVNNYEHLSFNYGPTLLSWLETHHPHTYQSILSADKVSRFRHSGHGNAIAQSYNHAILPLSTRKDKTTQVRWGIYDFSHRFGRAPEGMWLPETAVNEETLEVLVEEGIRYTVLSPYQAEAVRKIGDRDWKDVSGGNIDPKIPYRCFLKKHPEKFIDIFFYDGPISRGVGFDDLAYDSKRFMDRLESAVGHHHEGPQLIHAATDGETYGHHKPYGDRVLAYLLYAETAKRGYRVVNYAEFLEENPPKLEVKLKPGENGEGTAWSCSHGVRRWRDHCGCRGDGPANWNQHWRRPLRDALDWLRDELEILFERDGGNFLKNVWDARNDYISVILDRSEPNVDAFFKKHAKTSLNREAMTHCLKLLELQRQCQLMYTSCGWFFTELSGIETVQVMKYAARAIQLAKEASGLELEEKFLKKLDLAPSNIPDVKNGRGIYERYVRPSMVSIDRLVSHYAISSLFDGHEDAFNVFCYRFQVLSRRDESFGNLRLSLGRIRVRSEVTLEEYDRVYAVLQFGTYDFRCSILQLPDDDAGEASYEKLEQDLFDQIHTVHVIEILRKMDHHFGQSYYTLKDVFLEDRIRIISLLAKESIEKVKGIYEHLFDETRRMNEIYRSANLPIPEEIRFAIQFTLTHQFTREMEHLMRQGYDPNKAVQVLRTIELARDFDVKLKKEEIAKRIGREIASRTARILQSPTPELIAECSRIHDLAEKIQLRLHMRDPQEHIFELLKKWRDHPDEASAVSSQTVNALFDLAKKFRINPKEVQKGPARS